MPGYESRLVELVRTTPWFMDVLRVARAVGPRDWAVAAGVVRTLVWDHLHGFESPSRLNDVDVLFFDPERPSEAEIESSLQRLSPAIDWDAKNQAFIHEWYARKIEVEIAPYTSTEAGIAGFAETATAVGLRLEADDSMTVLAPLGLDDLFELKLRPSLDAPDPSYFEKRVTSKRWMEQWPRLEVVPPR